MMDSSHRPFAPSILLLFLVGYLVRRDDSAFALSSSPSSPRRGYHFGSSAASTTSARVTASDVRQRRPKSYVPDGMTEEEYGKIKADELAKIRKMDYGAWGPRFKRVDGDPDSNWFNLPSLWTGGYNSNPSDKIATRGGSEYNVGVVAAFSVYLRRYGVAYLVLLLSAQLLTRTLSAKRVCSSMWLASAGMLIPLTMLKPLSSIATILVERLRVVWLEKDGASKLAVVVAALVTLLTLALK